MTSLTLDSLPETLGFIPSNELNSLRAPLIEALTNDADNAMLLAATYRAKAEKIVDETQGNRSQIQAGLIIHMALVWRDSDKTNDFITELEDAHTTVWNLYLDDLAAIITTAIEAARKKNKVSLINQARIPNAGSFFEILSQRGGNLSNMKLMNTFKPF